MIDVLPISSFRDQIVSGIQANHVTIIVAETGAGKSTQVPQFLLDAGMKIVVTEPRRLAARSLAKRVAAEHGCVLGDDIGFKTGFEEKLSLRTRCLFVTDGLELVRETYSGWMPDALIIDEVHEWNVNIETLVAWSKKRLATDPNFRLVLMSATLEADRLRRYFGDALLLEVPGRLFPVQQVIPTWKHLADQVADCVHQGQNVLVFQPGKSEISQLVEDLREKSLAAVILPLHGDLEPTEQDRVFAVYDRPKVVVATNIAQTSITIPDINAVIDTGLERRIETFNGIEGLVLRRTAKSDDKQRMGRAGRCGPGLYMNFYADQEEQREFPQAEIQRVRLDQLVLRLAIYGFDATELEFFHQPDHAVLIEAKRALSALGAIDSSGRVTLIGRDMAALPISVEFARMVIEAKKLGVLDDVLTITSCLEVGGIESRKRNDDYLWLELTTERRSDLLVQLDLFKAARSMNGSDDLVKHGIHSKSFFRALEIRGKLADTLIERARRQRQWIEFASSGDRDLIVKACITGMIDHLYLRRGLYCHNGSAEPRQLDQKSVLARAFSFLDFIVGTPIDLEVKGRYGGSTYTLHLVGMGTAIDLKTAVDLAPQLFEKQRVRWQLLPSGKVTFVEEMSFYGRLVGERVAEITWSEIGNVLPEYVSKDDLLKECRTKQLLEAMRSRILPCLDIGDPGQMSADLLRPRAFGCDPESGQSLTAYPAIVKSSFSYNWSLHYFLTSDEARQAQTPFNDEFGSLLKPEIVQQAERLPDEQRGEWTDEGKRWWTCPNQHSVRAPKGATEITCEYCGESHQIN